MVEKKKICESTGRFIAHMSTAQLSIIGMFLGFGFGFVVRLFINNEEISLILSYPGKIFINMLKAVVIFFIIITMVRTPLEIDEIREAKVIGTITVLYSILTSIMASALSVFVSKLALYIKNSENLGGMALDDKKVLNLAPNTQGEVLLPSVGLLESFLKIGEDAIAPNTFASIVNDNILGVMVASLAFGVVLARYRTTRGGRVLKTVFDVFYQAIEDLVLAIIFLTPLGIFSLVAGQICTIEDFNVFYELFVYILSFGAAALLQCFLIYPLIYLIVVRKNPLTYYGYFLGAIMTAISTASSAASLPVGIESAKKAGVKQRVINFVMPLGATMNMDGTSIYYPATIIFIANYSGKSLSLDRILILCVISAFITIGSAPVPSGALVFLHLVANSIGLYLPMEIVSLIWAIDPVMDRCFTAINVTGVAYAAKVIEVLCQKFEKSRSTGYSSSRKSEKAKAKERKLSNTHMSKASRLLEKSTRKN